MLYECDEEGSPWTGKPAMHESYPHTRYHGYVAAPTPLEVVEFLEGKGWYWCRSDDGFYFAHNRRYKWPDDWGKGGPERQWLGGSTGVPTLLALIDLVLDEMEKGQ